ncbi:MAG: hypothetical protein QG577_82 [Thermodesulfobacteriota bacterium]|nr:hypothetical protein [Thermodesulfobacteriota bacterium]
MGTRDSTPIFKETLKMRALHTSLWAGVSLFWIAGTIILALDKRSVFGPVVFLLLGLPIFLLPSIKYVFGRVIVEITTDGMYVETTFPRRKRLKLLGWEQVKSCELKFYPDSGHLGFFKSGLFSPWSYGFLAAAYLRYGMIGSLHWKPLFGDKEVHFQVTRNGVKSFIVIDTKKPSDFVKAVEEAASSFFNKDFKVTVQGKPSPRERYYLPVVGLLVAVIIVGLAIVAAFIIESFNK